MPQTSDTISSPFIERQAEMIRKKIELYQDPETILGGPEEALTISALRKQTLPALIKALQRIENGIYESCHLCHRPIEKNRLKAVPEADTCMECSRKSH